MRTPFFRGCGDWIVATMAVCVVALMLLGVGYVTGRSHARIAQERSCRAVQAEGTYILQCLAQERGYVIENIGR